MDWELVRLCFELADLPAVIDDLFEKALTLTGELSDQEIFSAIWILQIQNLGLKFFHAFCHPGRIFP